MAHCTACGAQLQAGNRFCGNCGAPQEKTREDERPPESARPIVSATNGLAVASLVVGLLWFAGLGSVLAIILGSMAKREIRESQGAQPGEGYATAGIVLGWVGIVIPILLLFGFCAAVSESDRGAVSSLDRAGFVLDVTSELEGAAQAQEDVLEESGSYTDAPFDLQYDEYLDVETTIVSADGSGFCLEATHGDLNGTWYITEDMGRARRGDCP
jgi:hypothetical protein